MGESKEFVNIMTDMTGQFNRVIMVSKYDDLIAYEQSWKDMEKDTEANKKMAKAVEGYQDMYLTGSREIYRVW